MVDLFGLLTPGLLRAALQPLDPGSSPLCSLCRLVDCSGCLVLPGAAPSRASGGSPRPGRLWASSSAERRIKGLRRCQPGHHLQRPQATGPTSNRTAEAASTSITRCRRSGSIEIAQLGVDPSQQRPLRNPQESADAN